MSDTGSAGSHSHALKGTGTYAAGSHKHTYTDLVGTGVPGPQGPQGVPGPAGPPGVPDPTLAARIDALEARVAALETPPLTRPFPAPVTTREATLPSGIDTTGATDVAGALNAWVAAQPNGTRLVLPAGAVLLMGAPLNLNGRRHLEIVGNGATLRSVPGSPATEAGSLVQHFGSDPDSPSFVPSDIAIRNLRLVGANPEAGKYWGGGMEGAHGFRLVMGGNIELDGCDVSMCYGDGVVTDYWTKGLWVHDSTIHDNGRVGVAVLSGQDFLIERNVFDHNGGMVLDIEPYEADGGCHRLVFRDNRTIRQAKGAGGPFDLGYWAGGNGGGRGIRDIVIERNRADEFLRIIFAVPGTGLRYSNIAIRYNTGTVAQPGPLLDLRHIDGLDIRGNVQPLTSGSLASIVDCTGVVQ